MTQRDSLMDNMEMSGEFFRSQDMTLVSISLPKDYNISFKIMETLIELGCMHFLDKNAKLGEHQRRYSEELKICIERERQMKLLVNEANAFLEGDVDGSREEKIFTSDPDEVTDPSENLPTMEELGERLTELEKEVKQKGAVINTMSIQLAKKREHRYVVEIASQYLSTGEVLSSTDVTAEQGESTQMETMSESESEDYGPGRVFHICGTVEQERAEKLRSTLFRISRGMIMTHMAPLQELLYDPLTHKKVPKSVFVIWVTSETLCTKAKQICNGYGCNIYACPRMTQERQRVFMQEQELTEEHMEESQTVVNNTLESCVGNFWEVAHSLHLWRAVVSHHTIIYRTLNKAVLPVMHDKHSGMDKESEYLQARAWVPAQCAELVSTTLQDLGGQPGETAYVSEIDPAEDDLPHPTLFVTNKFTEPYLGLVEKYGVARYKEANPALFAMGLFSFQFGIMFGDVLHGVFLLIFASLCIVFEERLSKVRSDIFEMPFYARWMVLLMSINAIYMGIMYNELASVPVDAFGTGYRKEYVTGTDGHEEKYYHFTGSTYPIGLDPVWRWSGNSVAFTNSLKMKLAIIVGILQMTFGVILKLGNALHGCVGDHRTAIHESIPELVIFLFPFGYLIILIAVKWCTDWENVHQGLRGPPAILNTLINFAMFGSVTEKEVLLFPSSCADSVDPVTGLPDGLGVCFGQTVLQRVLLVCVVLSVPWLLLGKPFAIKSDMDERTRDGFKPLTTKDDFESQDQALLHDDRDVCPEVLPDVEAGDGKGTQVGDGAVADGEGHSYDEESVGDHHESFGEVMVHQSIHTIEYCLGTISNTASYLRLWALSLAHSQLSEVFWDYIFNGEKFSLGLNGTLGFFSVVVSYFIWFCATMTVLMMMESLSAFLHALRLQWVEFQGKFYAADGVLFVPTRFRGIDEVGDADE